MMFPLLILFACGDDKVVDTSTFNDDVDEDGYNFYIDCDDEDPAANPGLREDPYDNVDNDCDPGTPDDDLDGDGVLLDADCNDGDDTIYTGAPERCNGIDDDCDGVEDDGAVDLTIEEECGNGLDDNCDGTVDDCQLEGERTLDDADAWFEGTYDGEYAAFVGPPADLDGDGVGDGVVSTCVDAACTGMTYLFSGPLEGRLPPERAFATITGVVDDDYTLYARTGALDSDNGYRDLALMSESATEGEEAVGLFFGPVTGELSRADADVHIAAELRGAGRAYAHSMDLADLGGSEDVDILISIQYFDYELYFETGDGYEGEPTVALLLGPLTEARDLADPDLTITAPGMESLGHALVGDINGDGDQDLGLSDPFGPEGGCAWLIHGPLETGTVDDADAQRCGATDDALGIGVGPAGDMDGDGYGDAWIVSGYSDLNGVSSGDAALYLGGSDGLAAEPSARVLGVEYEGTMDAIQGDLNGDDQPDVLVSGYYYDQVGTVALIYGPVEGTRTVADADARILGLEVGDQNGWFGLYAGDHDGDEVDDVLTSAWELDDLAGGAYLFTSTGL